MARKTRHDFGQIVEREGKNGRISYKVRYATPLWAFSKFKTTKFQYSDTFHDKALAEAWRAQEERYVALAGDDWLPVKKREEQAARSAMTFAEFADHYVQTHRNADGSPLADGTVKATKQKLRDHLLPFFGHMPMVAISAHDVRDWVDYMDEKMGTDSNATWNSYTLLKTMMNVAATEPHGADGCALIDRSPCTVRIPRPDKQHETVPVTAEQVYMLCDVIRDVKHRPDIALIMMLGHCQGFRISETLGLRPCDVDLNDGTISISASAKETDGEDGGPTRMERGALKTKSSKRTVPIDSRVRAALEEQVCARSKVDAKGPLFPAPRAGGFLRESSVHNVYSRARLMVPGLETLCYHDFRHNLGSSLTRNVGPTEAAAELGHANARTTQTIYADVVDRSALRAYHNGDTGELPKVTPSGSADAANMAAWHDMSVENRAKVLDALPVETAVTALKALPDNERAATVAALSAEKQVPVMIQLFS